MAATRIIPMHHNKGKTLAQCLKARINYAENGEKTEEGKYISSYACDPKTAEEEFLLSKKEYYRLTGRTPRGDIIAYQVRQSFKPEEISPEEANKIGYELAMRLTKGRHAFLVATHTDRAHIHNHIIWNSTELNCTKKFRNIIKSFLVVQRISDQICLEYGVSVIKPKPYKERKKYTGYEKKQTIRYEICKDLDIALSKNPKSFEELLLFMEEKYEIKGGKNLAFKGKNQKHFIRMNSLGEGYSQKELYEIFKNKKENIKRITQKKEFDLLIDIQGKLMQGKGGGYSRWATVYNIKQMAQTLLFLQEGGIRTYEELEQETMNTSERFQQLSQKIKSAEKRLTEIAVLKTHISNYAKTREIYVAYRNSGYSKKYYEAHRQELTLHKAAKDTFSKLGDNQIPRVKELSEEYASILLEKKAAYTEYRQVKKEMTSYAKAKHNIDTFLKMQDSPEIKNKQNRERTK